VPGELVLDATADVAGTTAAILAALGDRSSENWDPDRFL
jgi:hypothetical protein